MFLRHLSLPDDTPMLISGMRNFVSRMDFKEFLPNSDEELVEAVQKLLDLGVVEILVVEHKDELVGGIGMLYSPYIWNSNILIAEELFFWASPEAPPVTALRLIRGARSRAREHGCSYWFLKSLTSSPEGLDKLYRAMRLQLVEETYMGAC